MTESRATLEPTRAARSAVTAAILALVATYVLAPLSHAAPNALLGVEDLRARVEPMPPSLQETGVTQTRVDSLLFTWLEIGGVPALPPNGNSREGLLRLEATHLLHSGWYVVQLSLEFSRTTALESDPNTKLVATVWSRDGLVMAKKKKLWNEVHEALDDMVAEFIHDYRAAHPQ